MALCDTQCRAQFEKSICLYVGALLGVWGIIPFFVCLTIILVDTVCVGWVWLGCCVRTV